MKYNKTDLIREAKEGGLEFGHHADSGTVVVILKRRATGFMMPELSLWITLNGWCSLDGDGIDPYKTKSMKPPEARKYVEEAIQSLDNRPPEVIALTKRLGFR